jgi:two-component system, NtrC family, sensor kinase
MIFASRIRTPPPEPACLKAQTFEERGLDFVADRMKPLSIFWLMVAAIVAMAALAYFDEEREASAALDDFAHEQTALAQSLAGVLSAHLTSDRQATLALSQIRATEEPDRLVLLRRPGAAELETTDGRHVREPMILDALDHGQRWLRLPPTQAGQLGLKARTALAGLSYADGDRAGLWGLAVVASAERERDREHRARWRLIVSVATASGLVLVFGGLALRKQRKELGLKHELEFADLRAKRDERLERAGRAATMGTLAVGVAHEISTPLGIIAGRAEQLSARVLADERAAANVRIILEQTDRIHRIIRGLLGLARGDRPTAEPIEPHSLVTGAVALVEHRFAKANVRLSMQVAPALPLVHGDPRLLEHAVVNLLLNACDACTNAGTVEVQASAAQGDLQIDVLDDGPGISDANRVLEPFFSTKPRGQGTGIGLAIVQEIVASHRGSLTLEPVNPHGTKATIKLPSSQESAHA